MNKASQSIAVVMRSYNDIDVIEGTLEMLSKQTLSDFELWNFASQSTDGTLEVIRRFNAPERVLVNDPSTYNPGKIMNEAVETVKADILVFLNSDATPTDEFWLERLVAPLADPTIGAVFGRQVARPDCRSLFVKDTERAFGNGDESASWLHFFSMANSAARRAVLKAFPFERAIQYSEDIEWSYRLRRNGYRVRYVPEAVAMHSHNYTLRQSWKRHFGEGVADAFIFREAELNRSWRRNFLLPFGMEVLRDAKWALNRRSLDALLHSVPLRFAQKWARWKGIREGVRREAVSQLAASHDDVQYTFDGNEAAERRIRLDQSAIRKRVVDAVPTEHFEALVLMGGYGRAEGGYSIQDGNPAPYNDYDYFLIVRGMSRSEARALQRDLLPLAHKLTEMVGVEVDLAVLTRESLPQAPVTLMNAEMKWGHHVLAGNRRVLDAMPAMPFDRLALGEFTRLMNNRGSLLLMNERMLARGEELSAEERAQCFRHLFKAVLACGDARLAMNGVYHPSYFQKRNRLRSLNSAKEQALLSIYERAVAEKFQPNPAAMEHENLHAWQEIVSRLWLDTFRDLEASRTSQEIGSWVQYANGALPKGQLEGRQRLRNMAITARDFGVRHAVQYLGWAWRYPRERLISVLPLLLRYPGEVPTPVSVPLGLVEGADRASAIEHYLAAWQRYA